MKKSELKKNLFIYLKVTVALLVIFWLLSLVEVVAKDSITTTVNTLQFIFYKLLHDFWAVLIIGVLFFPIFLLFNLRGKKYGELLFVVLGVFLVLGELSLIKYSMTTLLNLGADLLGYSYDDIYKTVVSSESLSITSYLLFLVAPLLFLVAVYFFKKKIPEVFFTRVILVLLILTIPLKFFGSGFNEAKYQNKISFLAEDILQFKLDKLQTNNYQATDIAEYPLLKHQKKQMMYWEVFLI